MKYKTLWCKKCHSLKTEDSFYPYNKTRCKECLSEYGREWREKNRKEKVHCHGKGDIHPMKKGLRRCTRCGEYKKNGEFYSSHNQNTCKKCMRAAVREYFKGEKQATSIINHKCPYCQEHIVVRVVHHIKLK